MCWLQYIPRNMHTVLLCFALLWLCNRLHEVFIHIHQGCFAGTGAIVRLPQCQWSKPDGYGKISQCITTTKHSKAKNRVHISWDILYVFLYPHRHLQKFWIEFVDIMQTYLGMNTLSMVRSCICWLWRHREWFHFHLTQCTSLLSPGINCTNRD